MQGGIKNRIEIEPIDMNPNFAASHSTKQWIQEE